MIELNLLKTIWSTVSSESNMQPIVQVQALSNNTTTVSINGVMNNTVKSISDQMMGSAAWMNYPISLKDITKMNFTLNWTNTSCPVFVNNADCSPQGGFALVFQQESSQTLGEYKNNLGEGLGYDGLSGLFAIEFDTFAKVHNNLLNSNQLTISLQTRNQKVQLLSTKSSQSLGQNSKSVNFASFQRQGFSTEIQVSVGIIPNQQTQQVQIVIDLNGIRQLNIKTSFSELGLDQTAAYYFGFTSAQNLNLNVASGTLDINNFKIYKSKPKFVIGQVSYLGDKSITLAGKPSQNVSQIEVRSSFYDLCMQKTTVVVYPIVSTDAWEAGQESEIKAIPYELNSDNVIQSIFTPINKPQFYNPTSLQVNSDVKMIVNIPVASFQSLKMGFYYYNDTIQNISAVEYQKQAQNSNYTFLVIENSDLITSTLATKGYANNMYQFKLSYFNGFLKPAYTDLSELQLTVTSDYIRLNNSIYSNIVPTTCYMVASQQFQNPDGTKVNKASTFTCSFLPNVNGTYYINSPLFPSGRSYKVNIDQADQVNEILSSEYSQAIVQGNYFVNPGTTIEILIDLRNNLNATYVPKPSDGCTFTNSYYFLDGTKYSFLFYDDYPYLRTIIPKSGTADFKITISCTRLNFDLQCYRCQKVILPMSQYFYYNLSIPTYPSTLNVQLTDLTQVNIQAGSNLVIDFSFFDRYDNIISSELNSTTDFKIQFNYGKGKTIDMQKLQVPGTLMFYLNDTDNLLVKKLRARTNLYSIAIQTPSSRICNGVSSENKKLYFLSDDKVSPMDFVDDGDLNRIESNMTYMQWDKIVTAGKIGRIHFTLKNINNLQMNQWLNLTNGNNLVDSKIIDGNNLNLKGSSCFIKYSYGLYEGEYLGYFYCNSGNKFTQIILAANGTNLSTSLPIYITPDVPSKVDTLLTNQSLVNLTLGNGGLNITFTITDDYGNLIDTNLINRDQPNLGLITYNLTRLSNNEVIKVSQLPVFNMTSGQFKLSIDNVPIGQYMIALNLPTPYSVKVNFISNSTILSSQYSYAIRENSTKNEVSINSYVTLRLYAKNIHNQSLTKLSDYQQFGSQLQVQLKSSLGLYYAFNFSGVINDTQGNAYYNFTSFDRIKSNAQYFITVYNQLEDNFIFVQNSIFTVNEPIDPINSELYLVKGLNEDEFRMIPFDSRVGQPNFYNSSYYDPRFDGSLRFKLYFRTSSLTFDFTSLSSNVLFTNAYLSSTYIQNNNYLLLNNITNISLRIINMNSDHLIIQAASQSDQDRIDLLVEGQYFLFLQGTNNGKTFQLQWMYSHFNSELGQLVFQNVSFSLFVPRFINVTAGIPYTFTASAVSGQPSTNKLTVTTTSTDLSFEIDNTTYLSPPGIVYYITVTSEKAGTYSLAIQARYSTNINALLRDVIVQVNPAPLYQMTPTSITQLTVKTAYTVGQLVSFNFTLNDKYDNNIYQNLKERPSQQQLNDMVQIYNKNGDPVEKWVQPVFNTTTFSASFTAQVAGIYYFTPMLLDIPSTSSITLISYNVTFVQSLTQAPSTVLTFASIRASQYVSLAGSTLFVDINLRDSNNLPLNTTQQRNAFVVNLVPDNQCNASTLVMSYLQQKLDVITYQVQVTRACQYRVNAYYFATGEGQTDLPCINCYFTVNASSEDIRRIELLDSRDISVSIANRLNYFANKQDQNPKAILIFRDQYENLVLNQRSNFSFDYSFDIVQTAADTVLAAGQWINQKTFHYVQFCSSETLTQPCLSNITAGRLRIQQLNATKVIQKFYIPLNLIDNYANYYNADNMTNDISLPYSYLRILNQDLNPSLGFDLPIITEKCIGNDNFPIIGRLDLKTSLGFRKNDSYANILQRISLSIDNLPITSYSYQISPGSTNGIILFALFIKEDFSSDRIVGRARIYIDNQEFTNRNISISCKRATNYQKFLIASDGGLIQSFENRILTAGQSFSFNMTSASADWLMITVPLFETELAFVNSNGSFIYTKYSFVQNLTSKVTTFTFNGITQAGSYTMVGPNIPDSARFALQVLPGQIASGYSNYQTDIMKLAAGVQNTSILIQLYDSYNNLISLDNTTLALFNSQSQAQIQKYSPFKDQPYQQAVCPEITSTGRIRCTINITQSGVYKWRLIINGGILRGNNSFVRVVNSGKVNINNTILQELSQNFYENQGIAFNKFNVQLRSQFIFFKVCIRDEYGNPYLGGELVSAETLVPRLQYQSTEFNLTVTKILTAKTTNATQLYRLFVAFNRIDTFNLIKEGRVNLNITTRTQGWSYFPYFIKDNRSSPAYPTITNTSPLKIRFMNSYQLIAGQQALIVFGIFDDLGFLQGYNSVQSYQFSSDDQEIVTGSEYIQGPFKGLYQKLIRVDKVTPSSDLQAFQQIINIGVDGFSSVVTGNNFIAIVQPGGLSQIVYNTTFQEFRVLDQQKNDIDFTYDSKFSINSIILRNDSSTYTNNGFQYYINYLTQRGLFGLGYQGMYALQQLQIIDSTYQVISNPLANYASQGIDLQKSYFQILQQSIISGQQLLIKVKMLDQMYQQVNISNNASALQNLQVKIIVEGSTSEINVNYSSVKINSANSSQWYTLALQVNVSGYHHVIVTYYGQIINSLNTDQVGTWLYVDTDSTTGTTPDQQWSVSMLAIQRNRVFAPQQLNNVTEYVQYLSTQPLYFLVKICDRFGNPFQKTEIYDFYNVGDASLITRISNQGQTQINLMNTQFVYNMLLIYISDPENRALYNSFVPSFFPLVNDVNYNSYYSYRIELMSPSSSATNIRLRSFYLVLSSSSQLENVHSLNVTNNRQLDTIPIKSSDFLNNQIQLRLKQKHLFTVQINNQNQRPYLSEQITNFSMQITNTTQKIIQNTTNPKNITNSTVNVTVDTVAIQVIPFLNDGFYRIYFYSTQLFQDPAPLNARATIQTTFTYNSTKQRQVDLALWVFPPTPPDYLNPISNITYLQPGKTKFQPASKIQFNITLSNSNMTYLNDYQSALRLRVFRKSALEQVTPQLISKSIYSFWLNLEGPQANEFRIYYQDNKGAYYPVTTPEVIVFQIQSSSTLPAKLLSESFLNSQNSLDMIAKDKYQLTSYKRLQAVDLSQVRIVIMPNFNNITYIIGNDLKAGILLIDNTTARCLLETDYSIQNDLQIQVFGYDPSTKQLKAVSSILPFITLAKTQVREPSSYCAYYISAQLENTQQLTQPGNYSIVVTFMNTLKSNMSFIAQSSGIDFRMTRLGWYQQPKDSNSLIAQLNAYQEFSYLIYFRDTLGNFVSDRQSFVNIKINFDGQKLSESTDYIYSAKYDDRFRGYLITIQFFKAGSFKPEYYFNLQRADNIDASNGPVLFVVEEPQCIRTQTISDSGTYYTLGQQFSFIFSCFDAYRRPITDNIQDLQTTALFINQDLNNQASYSEIQSLQNGIYRIQHKFYIEGNYQLKIYFNKLLVYSDSSRKYKVDSDICRDPVTNGLLYKCPLTPSVCAQNYYECLYVNQTTCPSDMPFFCQQSQSCVTSMNQCCQIANGVQPEMQWCPHSNTCFNSLNETCESVNTNTKIFCQSKQVFVRHQYECCEDLTFTNPSLETKNMVKCSNENKCVPIDNNQYCFNKINRNCEEVFGKEFSYQCPNDGKCRRNQSECPSSLVCPPFYTQCPDYTCIPGLDKFNQCNNLSNCSRTLPDGSVVNFIRCPDGSCSRTYESCPSMISCMIEGQVVCPDGSCQNSSFDCVQPNECTQDKPFKCAGQPSICAQTKDECPVPLQKTCGSTLSLCANGECDTQCLPSNQYGSQDYTSKAIVLYDRCKSQGMIQCPNFECRDSYHQCSDVLYCPSPKNFTYSPQSVICPSNQICALDFSQCSYSMCSSPLSVRYITSQNSYDPITQYRVDQQTCYDGRCYIQGRQKQDVCMTPLSCSNQYFKSGGFGEFCLSSTNISTSLMELSIVSNNYKCSGKKMMCVTGECRDSLDDCPSQTTCPNHLPIQCRDGQCVISKQQCLHVDIQIEKNLLKCQEQGLMLCTSDLITCTQTQSICPTRSTCPVGFIKCWDQSCIDPETQSCRYTSVDAVLSTCGDSLFHCFGDGSCRSSLEDCPSQTYCPIERPVKCAFDNSCRRTIKECPITIQCQQGYTFCPGEATCNSNNQCGTPNTCSKNTPYKCEDGTCVPDVSFCFTDRHILSKQSIQCLEHQSNILCTNTMKCVTNIMECPSSNNCTGEFLVKGQDSSICYQSREDFSHNQQQEYDDYKCPFDSQVRCQNGKCQNPPCSEWLSCPSSSASYKCPNGQCVKEKSHCINQENGCPFYLSFRCPYSGNCVQNSSLCLDSETQQQISNDNCSTNFGLNQSCSMDGSCAQSIDQCPTSIKIECLNIYQNEEESCFAPVCPVQLSFKCSNGLCVSKQSDCPHFMRSTDEIKYCVQKSQELGININVPCGNGICASSSDECLPLFDCSFNKNSENKLRCSDGTCKSDLTECPIQGSICPVHIPFMCQNGMCAQSEEDCLRNDNGCPERTPFKCEFSGLCTESQDNCQNPESQLSLMFNYPTFKLQNNQLTAYYQVIQSYCQANGQFTCKVATDMPYCVDSLEDCMDDDTGCPVTRPIRCGIQCISDAQSCDIDSCQSSGMQRCEQSSACTSDASNGQCSLVTGCPLSSPYPCTSSRGCSALPFSSFPQFYEKTCSQLSIQDESQLQSKVFNDCYSSDTPYSCADGSCVSAINECTTCIYYCNAFKRCVRSQKDCQYLQSLIDSSSSIIQFGQFCPLTTPIKCINNGQCVDDELDCFKEESVSFKLITNQTFSGSLIQTTCPSQSPLKCFDGRCVESYDDCINLVRLANVNQIINTLNNPIQWGQKQQNNSQSTCKVYCYDGSCRDRVENCPLIPGCFDPERPYRCQNGFCSKSKNQCIQLFGQQANNEDINTQISQYCTNKMNDGNKYERCEDGTCRPLLLNPDSNSYKTSCLPFAGCPKYLPHQCSTGECVEDAPKCAGHSGCNLDTPFRCKNYQCVKKTSDCERAFSSYQSLKLDRTISNQKDSLINFAFSENGDVIGKILIPSNLISIQDQSAWSVLQNMQRIQTYPVPDNILDKVKNQIPDSRIDYISRLYTLKDNNTLNRGLSLLSPVVLLEFNLDQNTEFDTPAMIYFKLDNDSIPSVINIQDDTCLARIMNLDKVLEGKAFWQCESRALKITDDDYLQYPLNSFGAYAWIINPNPDKAESIECGFICKNHLMLLILELVLIAFVGLMILALCICCNGRKAKPQKQQEKAKIIYVQQKSKDTYQQMNQSQTNIYSPPKIGGINNTTFLDSPSKMIQMDPDMDLDDLRDHLQEIDAHDPPLLPGQYVFMLNDQNEVQQRQINVLKSQLMEYQEKEIKNLGLLKSIFEKNKVLQQQIEEQKEKDSHSEKKKSLPKTRRPKKIKEDPSIMSEYQNIDDYLAQSMHQRPRMPGKSQMMSSSPVQDISYQVPNNQSFQRDLPQQNNIIRDQTASLTSDSRIAELQQESIYQQEAKMRKESAKDINDSRNQQEVSRFEDEKLQQIEEEREEEQSLNAMLRNQRNSPGNRARPKNQTSPNARESHILESSILSKTLNSIFPKNSRGRANRNADQEDTKGYNMVIANTGIAGSISGQIIKRSQAIDHDQSQRYEDLINFREQESDTDIENPNFAQQKKGKRQSSNKKNSKSKNFR